MFIIEQTNVDFFDKYECKEYSNAYTLGYFHTEEEALEKLNQYISTFKEICSKKKISIEQVAHYPLASGGTVYRFFFNALSENGVIFTLGKIDTSIHDTINMDWLDEFEEDDYDNTREDG